MKTVKIIVILIALGVMLYTLGSCTTNRICPTYSSAMHQFRYAKSPRVMPMNRNF